MCLRVEFAPILIQNEYKLHFFIADIKLFNIFDVQLLTIKTKHMDKKELMEIILLEEQLLWTVAQDFAKHLGSEHEATERAVARWNTISNLITKINEKAN